MAKVIQNKAIPIVVLAATIAMATLFLRALLPTSRPAGTSPSVADLKVMIEKLAPLHTALGKPKAGDWLEKYHEAGQTFEEYLKCRPALPVGKRNTIYVQPLGEFTKGKRKIVSLTAAFMGDYFGLAVKIKDDLPLSVIPADARRVHPQWGDKQVLSTYVLDKVLKPRLPDDAAAYIAFTASDLWPGEGWNFVFGQASLGDRVGVWSIHRNGDADDEKEFRLCLLRTMKTATHETGHMFSMEHCTAYECNMCGCNNREEADRHTIALCPQCLAKLCWAAGYDPVTRFTKLEKFFTEQGMKDEAVFCTKSIAALGGEAMPQTRPTTQRQ